MVCNGCGTALLPASKQQSTGFCTAHVSTMRASCRPFVRQVTVASQPLAAPRVALRLPRGVATTVRAASGGPRVNNANYRRPRTIPAPPAGRPPFPRPSPAVVGVWGVLTTLLSFGVYRWRNPSGGEEDGATGAPAQMTGTLQPQAGPVAGTAAHGATITVSSKDTATAAGLARSLAEVQAGFETSDDGVAVTIGFGPAMWTALSPHEAKGCGDFTLTARHSGMCDMPATGGDIVVHIQAPTSESRAVAVARVQAALDAAPAGVAVDVITDTAPGWTAFELTQLNPSSVRARETAAVDAATGGSYVLVQKWLHNDTAVTATPADVLQNIVGVVATDAATAPQQLGSEDVMRVGVAAAVASGLPANSHVARSVCASKSGQAGVLRHYVPFLVDGGVASGRGTMALTYAADPSRIVYALDRMAGVGGDSARVDDDGATQTQEAGVVDAIFNLSACVSGQVFYVPSVVQMRGLRAAAEEKGE